MDTHSRLFFALLPDEATRAACQVAARDINLRMPSNGRLTPPENFHVTLLFLGQLASAEHDAAAITAGASIQGQPFSLTFDHAAGFKESRVWSLGVNEYPDQLLQLRTSLVKAITQAGLRYDRKHFIPHLTIVRGANAPLPTTKIAPVKWDATEFVLMRSPVNVSPSRYEVIEQWPLNAAEQTTQREQYSFW